MIDVERVDYIRVPVADIEQAKHFYGELLGLRENPNSPSDDWIEYEAGNVTLAVMAPHTHEYEFAPLPPSTIALRVRDVEAAKANAPMISKVDSVGVPSTNTERTREFYVETLGLRPDERSWNEFWIGETCFGIWEPARFGAEFQPQPNGIALLQVDDVAAAREELGAKGVEFDGETFDTGVCHMATFRDPDGNPLVLHRRYAPYSDGSTP